MITLVDHQNPAIAAALHTLQQAAYQVESDLLNYPDLPPLREAVAELQAVTDEQFLAYQKDGRFIAALAFESNTTTLNISRLVVHPDHFRQGLARKLIHAFEAQATTQTTFTVSTAAANTPAVTLYQKHGYRLTEQFTLPDGLTIVTLQKDISP